MPLHFLFPFFKWCDGTLLGQWVRSGTWEFPMMETIHILALAMLFGCVVVVDLRLMGILMRGWTVNHLAQEVRPYLNGSLVIILATGAALYASEALKAFDNSAFWIKVYLLTGALVFHFTVVRRLTKNEEVSPGTGKIVGLISLVLWLGVGSAGRAIGFV